jgi:hypothetical protein
MDKDTYTILLEAKVASLEFDLKYERRWRECEREGHKDVSWKGTHSYFNAGELHAIETGFCHYCMMPTGRPLENL